jgi:hypothetical protein
MNFFVKKRERKGAGMSSEQIVKLIIAIIAFGILIAIAIPFILSSVEGDEEICRLSILTRATAPSEAQGIVPINCRTKKICITASIDGKCNKNFAGEKDVKVEKIPEEYLNKENWRKAKKFIEEKSVEAFYKCWSMTGKGKLDLFGDYYETRGLKMDLPACILCSRVALDPSVLKLKTGGEIEKYVGGRLQNVDELVVDTIDVHKYMEETKVPRQTMTYLEAMTDGQTSTYSVTAGNEFQAALEFKKTDKTDWSKTATWSNDPNAELPKRELKDSNDLANLEGNSEIAMIFSQVKTTGWGVAYNNLAKDALYLGSSAFMTPGAMIAAKRLILGSAGLTVGLIAAGATAVGAGYVAGTVYYGRQLAAGYCGMFTTNAKRSMPIDKEKEDPNLQGCSLVQVVPYRAGHINEICPQIERRP